MSTEPAARSFQLLNPRVCVGSRLRDADCAPAPSLPTLPSPVELILLEPPRLDSFACAALASDSRFSSRALALCLSIKALPRVLGFSSPLFWPPLEVAARRSTKSLWDSLPLGSCHHKTSQLSLCLPEVGTTPLEAEGLPPVAKLGATAEDSTSQRSACGVAEVSCTHHPSVILQPGGH